MFLRKVNGYVVTLNPFWSSGPNGRMFAGDNWWLYAGAIEGKAA